MKDSAFSRLAEFIFFPWLIRYELNCVAYRLIIAWNEIRASSSGNRHYEMLSGFDSSIALPVRIYYLSPIY